VEQEITEVLAVGLRFLPEAVILAETEAGMEKVIFVNQAFEWLSGYSLEELSQNRSSKTLIQPAGKPGFAEEPLCRILPQVFLKNRLHPLGNCHY
jgi:hypothetical protein